MKYLGSFFRLRLSILKGGKEKSGKEEKEEEINEGKEKKRKKKNL